MVEHKTVAPIEKMIAEKTAYSQTVGVYCLFSGHKLVYIGKSINVRARIESHAASSRFDFDSVFIHECDRDEATKLEAKYINAYLPPANIKLPKLWA